MKHTHEWLHQMLSLIVRFTVAVVPLKILHATAIACLVCVLRHLVSLSQNTIRKYIFEMLETSKIIQTVRAKSGGERDRINPNDREKACASTKRNKSSTDFLFREEKLL